MSILTHFSQLGQDDFLDLSPNQRNNDTMTSAGNRNSGGKKVPRSSRKMASYISKQTSADSDSESEEEQEDTVQEKSNTTAPSGLMNLASIAAGKVNSFSQL